MNSEIETNLTLQDLVDLDQADHKLKEIAILLLNSMNDWPTANQYKIADFVKEVKNYFGSPLSIKKIDDKKFDGKNAWQLEAGSSLAEMINISTKLFDESDFDLILKNILDFYSGKMQ